jgi:hypothetical protein
MARLLKFEIRFVKHGETEPTYTIQRKKLFGWGTLGYNQGGCSGGSVWFSYEDKNKDVLLKKTINEHLSTTKEFVRVIEHPMIKKY